MEAACWQLKILPRVFRQLILLCYLSNHMRHTFDFEAALSSFASLSSFFCALSLFPPASFLSRSESFVFSLLWSAASASGSGFPAVASAFAGAALLSMTCKYGPTVLDL